jgi:hypothetical protein
MANAREDQSRRDEPSQLPAQPARRPKDNEHRAAISAVTSDVEKLSDRLPEHAKDASKRAEAERDGEPVSLPPTLAAELAAIKERADSALNPPPEPPPARVEIVPPKQAAVPTDGEVLAMTVHDVDQLARKIAEQGLGINHNVTAAVVTELAAIRDKGVEAMAKAANKDAERAARA